MALLSPPTRKTNPLLAVSCYGGSAGPTKALFDAIPTLDAVMGSPNPLTSIQTLLASFELLARVYGGDVPADMSMLMTILNAGLTGGIVWTRAREDFEKKTPVDLAVEDAAATLIKMLMGMAGFDELDGFRRLVRVARRPSKRRSRILPRLTTTAY